MSRWIIALGMFVNNEQSWERFKPFDHSFYVFSQNIEILYFQLTLVILKQINGARGVWSHIIITWNFDNLEYLSGFEFMRLYFIKKQGYFLQVFHF